MQKFKEILKQVSEAYEVRPSILQLSGEAESNNITLKSGKSTVLATRQYDKRQKQFTYKAYSSNIKTNNINTAKLNIILDSNNSNDITILAKSESSMFIRLLTSIALTLYLTLVPNMLNRVSGLLLYLICFIFIFISNCLTVKHARVHGAEHKCIKAINDIFNVSYNKNNKSSISITKNQIISRVKSSNRLNVYCGTLCYPICSLARYILSALYIFCFVNKTNFNGLVYFIFSFLIVLVSNYLAKAIHMLVNILRSKCLNKKVYSIFIKTLLFIQYFKFTREPKDSDIELACASAFVLLNLPHKSLKDYNIKYNINFKVTK